MEKELEELLARGAVATPEAETLELARKAAIALWEAKQEAAELDRRLKEANAKVYQMERRTLPDWMNSVGLDIVGVPPAGNRPGFDIEKKPYYKANIAAQWAPERREKGFNMLKELDAGELLRVRFTVDLEPGDEKGAKKLVDALTKLKMSFGRELSVPWTTLTAWLRRRYAAEKPGPLSTDELEAIGGEVGDIVSIKQR